jgi:hypothetical protein
MVITFPTIYLALVGKINHGSPILDSLMNLVRVHFPELVPRSVRRLYVARRMSCFGVQSTQRVGLFTDPQGYRADTLELAPVGKISFKMNTNFKDFVVEVCSKPEMVTGSRNFDHLCQYITGYSSGISNSDIHKFGTWMREKYNDPQYNAPWFEYIKRHAENQDDLIISLKTLYCDFFDERTSD